MTETGPTAQGGNEEELGSRSAEPSFEAAMQQLEQLTRRLEDGDLGLSESLACYAEGIELIKQCHGMLRHAEQKISLLTEIDDSGSAKTEPFDEAAMTLEEKQQARGRRRSHRSSPPALDDSDMDIQKGLF